MQEDRGPGHRPSCSDWPPARLGCGTQVRDHRPHSSSGPQSGLRLTETGTAKAQESRGGGGNYHRAPLSDKLVRKTPSGQEHLEETKAPANGIPHSRCHSKSASSPGLGPPLRLQILGGPLRFGALVSSSSKCKKRLICIWKTTEKLKVTSSLEKFSHIYVKWGNVINN